MEAASIKSLKGAISLANADLTIRCDVVSLISTLVDSIEKADYEQKLYEVQRNVLIEKCKFEKVLRYSNSVEEEKVSLMNELGRYRMKAQQVRDEFGHDVGQMLNQSRSNERLKAKLKEAELKLTHYTSIEAEWIAAKRRIRELERINASRSDAEEKQGSGSEPHTSSSFSSLAGSNANTPPPPPSNSATAAAATSHNDGTASQPARDDKQAAILSETASASAPNAVGAATITSPKPSDSEPAAVEATPVPASAPPVPALPPASAAVTITAVAIPPTIAPAAAVPRRPALHLTNITDDESIFLLVISFVEMGDIMNVLLSCRHLCARMYELFEISYTDTVRQEWREEKPRRRTDALRGANSDKSASEGAGAGAATVLPALPPTPPPTAVSGQRQGQLQAAGSNATAITSSSSSSMSLTGSLLSVAGAGATSLFSSMSAVGNQASPAPGNSSSGSASQVAAGSGGAAAGAGAGAGSGLSASAASTGLTSELVDQLTKKLTPHELRAIISIREREQRANALLKEAKTQLAEGRDAKEVLAVKLESTERSRDFLAHKISEAERALKGAFDEIKVLKMQLQNDDKIIAFLDHQQQEQTLNSAEWRRKYEQLLVSFDLQRGMHSQLEQQLQSEIRQFKMQWEASEKDYKSQKRLLVKEVRTLRVQQTALTNERDKYYSQIQLLRNALGGGK